MHALGSTSEVKCLVTGATGFTGSHLCERLSKEGNSVRGLVRNLDRCQTLRNWGIEVVQGDLCDPLSLGAALKGIAVVYHIAAIFRKECQDPRMFWTTNAEGTKHLLEASIQNGVRRFVHCSTVGVHGHISVPPATEDTPYKPGDLYQETKLAGEKIAQRFMEEGKIAVTIFRPTGIYGPRDLRFLKLFRAIKKRLFVMLGSGEVNYHLTYIDDLIDGIIRCGTQDRAIGQTYILGGERFVTLSQLVAMIADELEVPRPRWHLPLWPMYAVGFVTEMACRPFKIEPPLYRRRIDFFNKSRAFDISKAKSELNYQPKIDLAQGIHRTAHWYFENGYL